MSKELVVAPFSDAQIQAIGLYQAAEGTDKLRCSKGHNLMPERDGMVCPFCGFWRNWVHSKCIELALAESMTLAVLQAALAARGDTNAIEVRFTKGTCGVRLRPGGVFVYGINLDRAVEAALARPVAGGTDTGRTRCAVPNLSGPPRGAGNES